MYLLVCILLKLLLCVRLRLSHADVVGGLHVKSAWHLPVYLCNNLDIVVTIASVYCFHVK